MWNLFVVLFQSLMLQIAANLLEQEAAEIITTKEAYLAENCAALDLSRDQAALMVKTSAYNLTLTWWADYMTTTASVFFFNYYSRQDICKKLHQAIDKIDEERYDTQVKVEKADKEVEDCVHLSSF